MYVCMNAYILSPGYIEERNSVTFFGFRRITMIKLVSQTDSQGAIQSDQTCWPRAHKCSIRCMLYQLHYDANFSNLIVV